ncbi:MAG TPA: hypothetical protein VGJ05_15100 [Fimbriiglobus sp.]|jgi:hypothetical protein
MDRDESPPSAGEILLPQTSPGYAQKIALGGAGLCAVAAVIGASVSGMESPPAITCSIRLVLVLVGAVTVGAAVSLAPGNWKLWVIGAGAGVLAWFGIPAHWDSYRLLVGVITAIAAAGAALAALPRRTAFALITLGFLFHYSAIFTATISPAPTPWIAAQLSTRVFQDYMQFGYLGNAYHFYSPEPGAASHLFFLITFEKDEKDPTTGKPEIESGWVTMPKRPEQVKDPLGVSYYRRLSLTELVSGTIPDFLTPATFEKSIAYRRRLDVASGVVPSYPKIPIPIPPVADPAFLQYRVPRTDITRHVLPSYAQHLLDEYSTPGKKAVSVKIYRLEHRILSPQEYDRRQYSNHLPQDPYHPTTYKPYFLGEYNTNGELVNPQDPMLYWLVPIVPKTPVPGTDDKDYIDYMSLHAKFVYQWSRP